MSLESERRLKGLLEAVDQETGARNLNLYGAFRNLGARPEEPVGTPVCTAGLLALLKGANEKTGAGDEDLTAATAHLLEARTPEEKRYSFGVVSDIHLQYNTGVADFQRALSYLKDRVAFTCIPGDLVSFASQEHMQAYKACVEGFAGEMPVYEAAGNHESYPELGVGGTIDAALWQSCTGKELYYSFTHLDDVFIFLSLQSERSGDLFPEGGLAWLEETLQAHKDQRCFVFCHAPELADRGADPSGTWAGIMEGTSGKAFVELIKGYPNVIWFHGHTHVTLGVAQYPVSDRNVLGYRSVHVPSLASPRFYDPEAGTLMDSYKDENGNTVWGSSLSEGYVVDVYPNKIVLRGMDFAAGANADQVAPLDQEVYALSTLWKEENHV